MAEKEIKKTAPKKKTAAKKKTVVKVERDLTPTVTKIYEDPNYLRPAHSVDRDLVKILARNPFQAYVFWKIHPDHFNHVLKEMGANDPSEIQFKLKVDYINHIGKPETSWYDLAPMTRSYFCNFSSPVKQLRAYLYANYFGNLRLFLETGDGDLPPGVESFSLDGDWIHPRWIELGWVKKTTAGEWKFTDSFDPEKDGIYDPEIFSGSFDGSSITSSRMSSGNFIKESKK
jgi:hypothetical protein